MTAAKTVAKLLYVPAGHCRRSLVPMSSSAHVCGNAKIVVPGGEKERESRTSYAKMKHALLSRIVFRQEALPHLRANGDRVARWHGGVSSGEVRAGFPR